MRGQLEKYCAHEAAPASSQVPTHCPTPTPSVLAEYGVETSDEDDPLQIQTVADEKVAYLTSSHAPKGTDTLLFWSISLHFA